MEKIKDFENIKRQDIVRRFVMLPGVLGVLLIITGLSGIYISINSAKKLEEMDMEALRPALEYQIIVLKLNELSDQLNFLILHHSLKKRKKASKKIKRYLKKIDKRLKILKEKSVDKDYQNYLNKWLSDWREVQLFLGDNSTSISDTQAQDYYLEIKKLIERIININDFFKIKVKETMEESRVFNDRARLALIVIMLLGLSLGLVFSVFIIKKINLLVGIIDKNKNDMKALLDNLNEGFMVFNSKGIIQGGVSRATYQIFEQDPLGLPWGKVLRLDSNRQVDIQELTQMIFSEKYNFNDLINLAPKSLVLNGKYIEISYRPIVSPEDNKLQGIICISRDKTIVKELEETALKDKNYAKMISCILKDRNTFIDFIVDIRNLITIVQEELNKITEEINLEILFCHVHTIKGGTSNFYLLDESKQAHQIENILDSLRSDNLQDKKGSLKKVKEKVNNLAESLERFLKTNEHIIGKVGESVREKHFKEETINDMYTTLSKELSTDSPILKKFVDTFVLDEISSLFEKYVTFVETLSEKRHKNISVKLHPANIRVLTKPYIPLVNSLVHVFRNAVDHGGESTTINVFFSKIDNKVKITIANDGDDLNVLFILNTAIKRGIISKEESIKLSNDQILQLIFRHGFSTKENVTDLSGRGIGLNALKHETLKLEGNVWVESSKGLGPSFHIEVPIYV